MLIAAGQWDHAEHAVRAVLVLDRRCRAQLIERHRLLFDSRFAAPSLMARDVVTLYFVIEGSIEHGGRVEEGPALYVLGVDELERVGEGSRTFRSWGAPGVILEVCMSPDDVRGPVGLRHGAVSVGDDVWRSVDAFRSARDTEERKRTFHAIMELLADGGLVQQRVPNELAREEPPHLTRLWKGLAGLYARHDTAAYLDLLSSLLGLSPRQIQRDVRELSDRFGFIGFRSTVKTVRLRRAVLLLSGPGLSIAEVASAVGYGSTDAMGRAFRDAGLPSPSAVRDAVLYDARETPLT